ncbi:glycoside hydrolase superfamily [Aspergillus floccosus]
MKFLSLIVPLLVPAATAASVFAGSNLYYAAGLTSSQQDTLFTGLQSAGVKVLRVWLDGQSSAQKGTQLSPFPSLERDSPGNWDDTVLNRLDDVMYKAHQYGIKLLISIHSYNALSANSDFYGKWYGTGDFYTDTRAIAYFKNRIAHVLAHVNPHNGKTWAQSSEYIFAFEAQNEAMHDQENPSALTTWQCTMAQALKSGLNGNTGILVTTGGGAYLANSLLDPYFSCAALDVLAIHAYGTSDFATSALKPYVSKALASGKKLIMQEWGACYYNFVNNRCSPSTPLSQSSRDGNIKAWASSIAAAGIPWFYWQILPNEDPHQDWDYEVGINGVNWAALQSAGNAAASYTAAFDFSSWLLQSTQMASLVSVPVSLPGDKIPTKTNIRDIIGTFLTAEWPFVEPETLRMSYHASFANAHCPVERPQSATGIATEPLKVFIKFHHDAGGDLEIFKDLVPTKQEEALLCSEYGRTGLGAKVYGFFKTQDGTLGRVDEFLEAHNMQPEDVENADIRADVAKGLAMLHTLECPLRKRPVESYYETVIGGLESYHKADKLKALGKEGGVSIDDLVDYDFGAKLRKVVERLESHGGKTGWCIHDVQFMNVMVRNEPKEGESKVALIDFEFVMRNYRAFDIGGHFMQKMFKWFDEESRIADCRKYTEEEKRHFCEEYAKQWNKQTGDSDTGDQVFLESEYGYLLAITFDIHNMLCFMAAQNDGNPLDLIGLNKLFDEFVGQYTKLGLEES